MKHTAATKGRINPINLNIPNCKVNRFVSSALTYPYKSFCLQKCEMDIGARLFFILWVHKEATVETLLCISALNSFQNILHIPPPSKLNFCIFSLCF